jgi:glycosyltransferase involved in cell wall biosynthesis
MPLSNRPKLSIIIPTLNEAKYLPGLLSDLSRQTRQQFEVILVDAHSTDLTLQKARGYQSRLPALKIYLSKHRNVCLQRNLGARYASAPELLFLDADDHLDNHFLEDLFLAKARHPADLYTTNLRPDPPRFLYRFIVMLGNSFFQLMSHTSRPFLTESLVGVNRAIFNTLGGFDPAITNGEGNTLASLALRTGYRFYIYTHPTYAYSWRRVEIDGLWRSAIAIIQLSFSLLIHKSVSPHQADKLHPMKGGSYYGN